jgi:hypothetical protein
VTNSAEISVTERQYCQAPQESRRIRCNIQDLKNVLPDFGATPKVYVIRRSTEHAGLGNGHSRAQAAPPDAMSPVILIPLFVSMLQVWSLRDQLSANVKNIASSGWQPRDRVVSTNLPLACHKMLAQLEYLPMIRWLGRCWDGTYPAVPGEYGDAEPCRLWLPELERQCRASTMASVELGNRPAWELWAWHALKPGVREVTGARIACGAEARSCNLDEYSSVAARWLLRSRCLNGVGPCQAWRNGMAFRTLWRRRANPRCRLTNSVRGGA